MRRRRAGLPVVAWLVVGGCAWISGAEFDRRLDLDQDGSVNVQFGGADCDDGDPSSFPGAPDPWYDGVDANCDGWSDYDADHDGADTADHGGPDCDDDDAQVGPHAADPAYDGVDTNCDGWSDYDADGDGHDAAEWGGDDCDDTEPLTYAGADDPPYDGIDEACDGDEFEYDADRDQYVAAAHGGADCDDNNADVYPDAPGEEWYDGVDTNCDGVDDCDKDGDGYGADGVGVCTGHDCNDDDPGVNPGEQDTVLDGGDTDCDGNPLL